MTTNKKTKELARQLYITGNSTEDIAGHCNVSQRTVQRWIKDFQRHGVTIACHGEIPTNKEMQEQNDTIVTPTIFALEKVANLKSSETINLSISSRLAIRFLNLAESAIATVEECLENPEVRWTDKLKAAELVAEWTGLDSGANILAGVAHKFDAKLEVVDAETGEATITSRKQANALESLEFEQNFS